MPASPLLQHHRPSQLQQAPGLITSLACRASGAAQQPAGEQPWKLMGRVVTEESIQLSQQQKRALITSAAATASGLAPEEFDARLQASRCCTPLCWRAAARHTAPLCRPCPLLGHCSRC